MRLISLFKRNNMDRGLEMFRNTPGAVLLDVRTKEEFAEGHIPGSINVPVETISETEKIVKDHDAPVFIYCLRGTRSIRAAIALRRLGYKKAQSIGGINAYHGEIEK